MIIYRQQLLENNKFSLNPSYGWTLAGNGWVKQAGSIRKTSAVGVATISQTQLLTAGVTYRLIFRMYNRTGGTLTVTNKASGIVHLSTTTNQVHTVNFTADGTDLIFNLTSTWDGNVSMATLVQTPDEFSLDLTEEIPVPLNFNIDDIFKVNSRKNNFSKTIILKGTHNNNIALNHIYNISSDSLFNPNISTQVIIKNSGIPVFTGSFCLDDIIIKINNNSEDKEYHASVNGELLTIYDKIGNLTVKDLDFSEYDHAFTLDRIFGSWFNDITINGATGQANSSNTYTSPTVTAVANVVVDGYNRPELTFATNHSFVAGDDVYYDLGVAPTEYSFNQKVLQVTAANKIVLETTRTNPFSALIGGTISKRQLSGFGYWYPCVNYGTWIKNFYATGFLGGNGLLTVGQEYVIKTFNTGDDFTNVGALSNTGGEIFTAATPVISQASGTLNIGQEYTIQAYSNPDNFSNVGGPGVAANNTHNGVSFTATGTIPASWAGGSVLIQSGTYCTPTLWTGPSVLITLRNTSLTSDTLMSKWGDDTTTTYGANDTYWEPHDFVPHIFLREIFVKTLALINYEYISELIDSKLFRRIIIPLDQTYTNTPMSEGLTLSINDYLPNIKLVDVLTSILNAFNLVIKPDGDDKNILRFINRGGFFDNPPVVWTDKLQTSENLEIQLMNRDFPKTYVFKLKDSGDFYNSEFNTDFGDHNNGAGLINIIDRKYGDYFVEVRSDFLSKENKVELIFEPSVLTGHNIVPAASSMLMPTCYNADAGEGTNIKRSTSNRWLIAGLRYVGSVNYVSSVTPLDNRMQVQYYPFAGHIDNHFQPKPSDDINFGMPLGIYFNDFSVEFSTDLSNADWDKNCLYRKYWKRYISAIANKQSKIISGYFKLSVSDVYNLDFQKPVRVGDYLLKLNKVIDWDVNGTGICKCEFLTIN